MVETSVESRNLLLFLFDGGFELFKCPVFSFLLLFVSGCFQLVNKPVQQPDHDEANVSVVDLGCR